MADYDPKWADAISSIESGGDYGQVTPSGNRAAYGKYQVMGENIPEWTQAALGKSLTPDQYLADPDAQDAVFKHRFGGYVDQYGTPQDAASAWFTGRPINASSSGASDRFGTTGSSYVAKFNKAMGNTDGPTAIQSAMGGKPRSTAMGFAATDDDDEDTPALTAANSPGPGALAQGGAGATTQAPQNWLSILGQTLANMAPGIAQDPDHAKALTQVAAQLDKGTNGGSWTTAYNPVTGIATQTNSASGATRQFKYAAPKDDSKWGKLPDGTMGYIPTPEQYAASAAKGTQGPSLLGDASKDGPDYLKTVDPVSQQIINGWHEGTGVMPSSFKMNDPKVQQLMASAQKAYPDLDFTRIGERKTFANDAAKSSPSSIGGQITNSNTAVQNLNNLADKYVALKNNNGGVMPAIVGRGINAVSNANADAGRSAIINGLNTNADDASGEITKVLTGGPGGTHERGSRKERLGNPNYTPTEAAGVLEAEAGDLKGKHDQLIDHTRATMGQAYLDKHPEIGQNFEDQHALLRDKIAQLRGSSEAQAKPTTGTFQNVPWSIK